MLSGDWSSDVCSSDLRSSFGRPYSVRLFCFCCFCRFKCCIPATGKKQSSKVGSGQNQSEPDVEKQTHDRLVRPDFMYQTERKMSLVLTFWYSFWSLPGYRHLAPMSAPVAGTALGWARGRTGRESLRQGEGGAHVGLEYATPHQSAARCGTMKGCR